jgi:class 3 adenylate cyclase
MFCDLVESTALSGQLDPEDLQERVRAYQQVCSDVIARFEGHIAQLLGDGLLAEAHGVLGEPQAGLTVLTEALTLVDTTAERWYAVELHRLKGELLLSRSPDNHTEAETYFQHAINIAQSQHAKSCELRAAISLSRLWQQQGKRQEARQVLGDVYNWFTEGFDTADLQDAKALLVELS